MHTITWIERSAVPGEQLGLILSDCLALERIRIIRRLLIVRCGMLALLAAIAGPLLGQLSVLIRIVPVALFLLPPVWAWILERRINGRLSHRLKAVDGSHG